MCNVYLKRLSVKTISQARLKSRMIAKILYNRIAVPTSIFQTNKGTLKFGSENEIKFENLVFA